MWEARTEAVSGGVRCRLFDEGAELTFRGLFRLLETEATFADWYSKSLLEISPRAFFWELPPLTERSFDREAEFVLIESASLDRLDPDPEPFSPQFSRHPDSEVIAFANLGGDALLVVPTPIASHEAYPHLAAFLEVAPKRQTQMLWKTTARVVRESLSTEPTWLSTAGLGVSWLHLRLDTRPKYYRFATYATAP